MEERLFLFCAQQHANIFVSAQNEASARSQNCALIPLDT